MTRAVTAKFEEMILEVEFVASSGTFVPVCGLVDVNITRESQIDEQEVPDCDDESLPLTVELQVRSQSVTVEGTGVWAQSSHGNMMDWWYSGATKNVRIRNTKAATGDTQIEYGPAILASLNNSRNKGSKISAEVSIRFDGVPSRTDA